MAKRKKRKQPELNKEQPESVSSKLTETVIKNAPNQVKSSKTKGMARISTCVAGMFLCFVLGVYCGTLLPDILHSYHKSKMSDVQNIPASSEIGLNASQPSETTKTDNENDKQANLKESAVPPELEDRIRELETEAADKADDASIWTELGNVYFDTGQVEKAIHAYEHSLAIKPENPDVLTDLGIMQREAGNFDKALECFRKASSINPRHINALFNEGVVLAFDLHNKNDAIKIWEQILEINPAARTPDGSPLSEMIRGLR